MTHELRYIPEFRIVVEVVLSERPAAVAELELLPDIPLDVGLELPDGVPGERPVIAVHAAEQRRYVALRDPMVLQEVLPRVQEVEHHGSDDLRDGHGPGLAPEFLEYCRLRAFRRPGNDDYGWARLAQVIGNFMGADGCSVGVDDVKSLDMDNGDNGVYLMKDWKIVGRRFYDSTWEQNEYRLCEFLHYLDKEQPENQQLGGDMIDCLMHHGKTISDVCWNYSYEMNKRKEEGIGCTGFKIGSYYSLNERQPDKILKVVDKPYMELIVEKDGAEITLPRFQ